MFRQVVNTVGEENKPTWRSLKTLRRLCSDVQYLARSNCRGKGRKTLAAETMCANNISLSSTVSATYTAAKSLLLTPAKKPLLKRPDKYWRILSQPTYGRRTPTPSFAQPCVSDTLVGSQESAQEKLVQGVFEENTNTVLYCFVVVVVFHCCYYARVKNIQKKWCATSARPQESFSSSTLFQMLKCQAEWAA